MGSLSQGIAYNAGKRDPKKPRVVTFNGERRTEKWPQGHFRRMVDPKGNVVQVQLVQPGVPATADAINASLHRHRELGFVDHGQCPLRNGLRFSDRFRDEFAAMPRELQEPCSDDPRVAGAKRDSRGRLTEIACSESCGHIEWLIKDRVRRATEDRDAKRAVQKNYEEERLKLAEAQLEETRKANERMIAVAEAAATKGGRKGTAE